MGERALELQKGQEEKSLETHLESQRIRRKERKVLQKSKGRRRNRKENPKSSLGNLKKQKYLEGLVKNFKEQQTQPRFTETWQNLVPMFCEKGSQSTITEPAFQKLHQLIFCWAHPFSFA